LVSPRSFNTPAAESIRRQTGKSSTFLVILGLSRQKREGQDEKGLSQFGLQRLSTEEIKKHFEPGD
jgi:hypothetical protein